VPGVSERFACCFTGQHRATQRQGGQSITRKCNAFGANEGFVDEHTREPSAGMVERRITGEHLIGELSRLATERDAFPAVLRCDEGLELRRRAMANWSSGQVGLHAIPPDQPWRNGYVESPWTSSRVRPRPLAQPHGSRPLLPP
jgi:hypothetical protein